MRTWIAISICLMLAFSGSAVAETAKPWYLIAQIEIRDQEDYFESYGARVVPMLARAGAKVLVASANPDRIEGNWQANWTVVIEFPSEQAARSWYASDEYQQIRPLRLRSTSSGNLVLSPGFTGLPEKK